MNITPREIFQKSVNNYKLCVTNPSPLRYSEQRFTIYEYSRTENMYRHVLIKKINHGYR